MSITEEEKNERRKNVQMDLNIVGSGFDGEVCKELRELPAHELWINGKISHDEYIDLIHNYVESFRKEKQ